MPVIQCDNDKNLDVSLVLQLRSGLNHVTLWPSSVVQDWKLVVSLWLLVVSQVTVTGRLLL